MKLEVNPLSDLEGVNFLALLNFHLRDLIKKNHAVKAAHHLEQNLMQTDHSERNQVLDLEETEREVHPDSKKKEVILHLERTGFRELEISPSHVLIAISHEVKKSPHLEENQILDPSATAKDQGHSPAKEMMIKINLSATKDFPKGKADFHLAEKRNFLNRSKKEKKGLIGFPNSKKKMKSHL